MSGQPRISIHALRAEGDLLYYYIRSSSIISIHALRAEGDSQNHLRDCTRRFISIHALRAEGDLVILGSLALNL